MQETGWSNTTKLVVVLILVGIGGWVLVTFSEALPSIIISGLLAYLLIPPTDWLVRHTGLPRGLAVGVIYLILLLLLILTPIVLTPSITSIASSVQFDMAAVTALADNLSNTEITLGPVQLQVGEVLLQSATGLQQLLSSFGSQAILSLLNVLSSLFWVAFVVVVTFWLVKDSYKLEKWFFEHLPKPYRKDVSYLLKELNLIWGSFFKGTLVLAIIVGTLVGLAMWILGIQHVLLLAIFAGFMEFIPSIGPAVGAILATLIAFLGGSSWLPLENWMIAILVLVVYTLIFQFEQVYLYPRIVGRRVNLHPGIVFVGAILGAVEFGVLGVLLAAPVLASARVLGRYLVRRLADQPPFPEQDEATATAIRWRGMLRGEPIAAVLFDLDGTLAETDETLIQRIMAWLGPLNRLFPNNNAETYVRRWVMRLEPVVAWVLSRLDAVDLDDDAFNAVRRVRTLLGYKKSLDLQPVDGALPTLETLRTRYRLGLVTTRDRHSTRRFLDRYGFTPLFDVIIAREDVHRLKPHPEPVIKAAEALGVEPVQCVMVGDTLADIHAARAAGAASVGVLTGFGTKEALGEADVVVDSINDLPRWL
ncbi:MAG TPA: AI-2E family transporter [Anaerolineae bacterium]|nr:AI-2E family transporter [Anaerolineae bacterium]